MKIHLILETTIDPYVKFKFMEAVFFIFTPIYALHVYTDLRHINERVKGVFFLSKESPYKIGGDICYKLVFYLKMINIYVNHLNWL